MRCGHKQASNQTIYVCKTLLYEKENNDEQTTITNRTEQINHLIQQRDVVHQRLNSNAIKMKTYYDHHLKHHTDPLQKDDWVLVHNETKKISTSLDRSVQN